MPLELAAEVLVRFVFATILYTLGYATGWLIVPALSFGRYSVEPLAPPKRGASRALSRGARPPRQLSAEAAAYIGILFWAATVATGLALWWFSGPN